MSTYLITQYRTQYWKGTNPIKIIKVPHFVAQQISILLHYFYHTHTTPITSILLSKIRWPFSIKRVLFEERIEESMNFLFLCQFSSKILNQLGID